jgi:hypothetical protein
MFERRGVEAILQPNADRGWSRLEIRGPPTTTCGVATRSQPRSANCGHNAQEWNQSPYDASKLPEARGND